jgi:hypothetical protein
VNKEERLSLEEIENHKWLKLMNEKIWFFAWELKTF